jgi:hypothetical protein
VPLHWEIAKFFWAAKPGHGRSEIVAPNLRAMSRVRSVDPESTMMTSSAKRTLSRVRARFSSSLSVIMATERRGMEA